MAGNYPDVNSWRMAYDVDGTQVYLDPGNGLSDGASNTAVSQMNSETLSGGFQVYGDRNISTGGGVSFIFPELRDVDGWLVHIGSSGVNRLVFDGEPVLVSENTTNGVDGTWVQLGTLSNTRVVSTVAMRENIAWATALGVKAIQFRFRRNSSLDGDNNVQTAHLYGEPVPGVNLQRLEIWHPTLDQRLGPADLDWGDVPRNSEEIRTFRVKNMHPTLSANDVRVAMSISTDTSPSVVGQQSLSQDGGSTWAAQQTLPAPLGPGAISPVLHLRRQTANNATLSLWWYRVFADALSWS